MTVEKTPGLIGLERFIDNIGRYMESSEVDIDAWNEAVDNYSADLNDSAREGLNLLVRVALAARVYAAGPLDGSDGAISALQGCVEKLNEWEKGL